MTKAYKLANSAILAKVILEVTLPQDADLPEREEVYELFAALRDAFGNAVESLGLWNAGYQCVADVEMEIRIDGDEEDWLEATFGTEWRRSTRRGLTPAEIAAQRVLVTKVEAWNIADTFFDGVAPQPHQDRFVFVK
jgi:hypothetical protein